MNQTDSVEGVTNKLGKPGGAAEELLLKGIAQAFTDSDEVGLDATVRELRLDEQALESAIRLYEASHEDRMLRWAIVYLAAKIGAAGTAQWFRRVVDDELPALPPGAAQGCQSPRDEEVLVRVMAVEGLARRDASKATTEEGLEALAAIAGAHDDAAVRSAAVLQLLRIRPGAAAELRLRLPDDSMHLLDARLHAQPTDLGEGLEPGGLVAPSSGLPPMTTHKGD